MKNIKKILLFTLFTLLVMLPSKTFALTRVANLEELQNALTGTDEEIVVTQTIQITGTVSLDGHNKTVRAEVVGVNDQGLINTNASNYNVFKLNTTNTSLTISNMHLKGGAISAIEIASSGINLKITDSSITNTGSDISSGSAIETDYYSSSINMNLENVLIANNVASYAGGIFISGGTKAVLNNVSLVNNRNIDTEMAGGGAIENKGYLYINNSIIANNYSTEIGGAINNNEGKLYIMNTTITGNVTESMYVTNGGGIGNHGSNTDMYVANSIITNNYQLLDGVYTENDIGITSYTINNIFKVENSVVGAVNVNDITTAIYTHNNVKSDTTNIFFAYEDGKLIDKTGAFSLTSYKRPVLKLSNKTYNAYLSATGNAISGGVYTFFDTDDSLNVKMSYGTTNIASDSTSLGDLTLGTTLVNTYIDGTSRINGIMGASGVYTKTLYKLTAAKSDNGQVVGATIFGDYYDEDTIVTLSAIPNTGYYLEGYEEYKNGNWVNVSKTLKYQVKMNRDILVRAVFTNDETKKATTDINDLSKNDDNLLGNQTNPDNPNTGDNIVIYGSLLVISLLSLGVCFKLKQN